MNKAPNERVELAFTGRDLLVETAVVLQDIVQVLGAHPQDETVTILFSSRGRIRIREACFFALKEVAKRLETPAPIPTSDATTTAAHFNDAMWTLGPIARPVETPAKKKRPARRAS